MKSTKYVIIRHGSNASNQPMSNRVPLGILEAKNKKEAWEEAQKKYTFFVGQYCEVIPESKASVSDWNEAVEQGMR